MADHIGIVIQNEPGGYARVLTDRKGACGGCEPNSGGCRSCLSSANKMESRVANSVGAEAGDLVKVHLSSGGFFTGAAILYLLPIFGLLFGAVAGMLASPTFGWSDTAGSIAGAFIGLAAGYGIVIALDRNASIRRRLMPTITTIVQPNLGAPKVGKETCCASTGHA